LTTTFPTAASSGQFGAPCAPPMEASNAACDSADGFSCFGTSPTDANAFCTTIDRCQHDSDCPGGWWCAAVNLYPNVTMVDRKFGPTRQVCIPRAYCAPCQLDHDCLPAADGRPQHCVSDAQGNGFCTETCSSGANCPLDAACTPHWKLCLPGNPGQPCARDEDCPPNAQNFAQHCDFGSASGDAGASMGQCAVECASNTDCDNGQKCGNSNTAYCTPNAGVCRGDGSLCAPCRSDDDCTGGGYCVVAPYSHEHFCTFPANGHCPTMGMVSPGTCPAAPKGATYPQADGNGSVACWSKADDLTFSWFDQCVGFVSFGTDNSGTTVYSPGCWTANR
jgi:hypothetical protein